MKRWNVELCTSHAPWNAEFGLGGWNVLSARKESIAFIRQSIVHDEANARLIASAPELLRALERLLYSAESLRDDLNLNAEPESFSIARAIISKAKGGEA